MMKGVWKEEFWQRVIKHILSGAIYLSPESVHHEYLKSSDYHTTYPWKGLAYYYHVEVDGVVNQDAAWYYPEPKPAADQIKNYVAFWKGIEVISE